MSRGGDYGRKNPIPLIRLIDAGLHVARALKEVRGNRYCFSNIVPCGFLKAPGHGRDQFHHEAVPLFGFVRLHRRQQNWVLRIENDLWHCVAFN